MLSSEITRELQSLTQTWRNNNFVFTGEQRRKYDRLLSQGENLSSNGRKKVEFIVLLHQPKLRLRKRRRHEIYSKI